MNRDDDWRWSMQMRRLFFVASVAISLSACTSDPIVFVDPATGQTHDCGSRAEWTNWWGYANIVKERNCVAAYQAGGWRLSQ
jgi:hypothetical protein